MQNQQPVWFRQKGVGIGGRWRGAKEGPFGLERGSVEVGRVLGMVMAVQRGELSAEFKCALRAQSGDWRGSKQEMDGILN